MLALSCERAGVADGMRILDLGCGWGSLSLWLAERYPAASITGVSKLEREARLDRVRARPAWPADPRDHHRPTSTTFNRWGASTG